MLVTSRLDYCNSLLAGAASQHIRRLQRMQNTCARLIMCRRKYDHVTPLLRELHWLPVHQRIQFKLLVITYKALHGLAPTYICDLLHVYSPSRSLRSEHSLLLTVPRTKLSTYCDRTFQKLAALLWNSIRMNIKAAESVDIFKKHLKTHLFCQAF